MPRRKYLNPTSDKHIQLPIELQERVDEQLQDPLSGKVRYGGWRKLVESLLREWVENKEAQSHADNDEPEQ